MSTEPARYTLAWPRRRLSGPFFLARSLPTGTFPPYPRFSRVLVPTPTRDHMAGFTKSPESEGSLWPRHPDGAISFKEPIREHARR